NVRCVLRVIDVGKEHCKQQATFGTGNASRGPLVPMGPEQLFLEPANRSGFIKSNRTKRHLETPLITLRSGTLNLEIATVTLQWVILQFGVLSCRSLSQSERGGAREESTEKRRDLAEELVERILRSPADGGRLEKDRAVSLAVSVPRCGPRQPGAQSCWEEGVSNRAPVGLAPC